MNQQLERYVSWRTPGQRPQAVGSLLGSLLGVALLCANVGCSASASNAGGGAGTGGRIAGGGVPGGGAPGGDAPGGGAPSAGKVLRGLQFATVGDAAGQTPLLLDLYLPSGGATAVGVIVWVHGGAWRSGSRESADLAGLTSRGWAVASVDYRLSPVARFPAQVHDIKAAIRHLRAHAADHGLPASPFVIAGSSAGGHLAALVGVSNGVPELEGEVGSDRAVSSDVQGIVSLYGASNLTNILAQSTPHGVSVRVPALELLLGGQPDQRPELARLASPIFHVNAGDPPLLLLHGDSDQQMPSAQSQQLAAAYEQLQLPVQLVMLEGAGHGGAVFTDAPRLELIDGFLRARLFAVKPPAVTPPAVKQ